MKLMLIFMMFLFILSSMLMILANLLSKKTFMDREKSSPFECGFDPKNSARLSFSLHFFLISIIFLIFDVEITFLLPMIYNLKIMNLFNYMMIYSFFIFILLAGLYHEWNYGALEWN
uniref:NADH-ubiquinone oxidoreductase chain 3 n=1 Tax=Discolomatidae sp. 4 ACP-2013 TaxID=1434487 RepID=A0A3G3FWU7_9CUCU|nr:NADH dehydrogenase subunit 3 [Discolomatidae sp. 4 ACP-2013]